MGRKDEIKHGAVTAPTYIDKRNKAKKFDIEKQDLIQQADFFALSKKCLQMVEFYNITQTRLWKPNGSSSRFVYYS